MKLGKRILCCGFVVAASLLLIDSQGTRAVFAQQKDKKGAPSSKADHKYLSVYHNAIDKAVKSTVRVLCDGKETALGVAVTADGFILTKASDLKGKITVKLGSGEEFEAKWVGQHEAHDLAMLKIDAKNLVPIEFTDSKVAPVGNFVASAGMGSEPVTIGVVSVAAREMPAPKDAGKKGAKGGKGGPDPKGPNLGVTTVDDPKGAKVTAAGKGGFGGGGKGGGKGGGGKGGGGGFGGPAKIKVDDIIVALGEKEIKNSEALNNEMKHYKIGDEITLRLLRGEEEMELKMKLNPPQQKQDQNKMGSVLSNRISGFPVILQHDSVILPTDCGSALVDLSGHVIGINIARAGRVESHAIPSETIRPLLPDLMSGKLPPKTK